MEGKDGKTKMKYIEQEFGLSIGKIRKLLVSVGVYAFGKNGVDLVQEIARMKKDGTSDEQIKLISMSELLKNRGLPDRVKNKSPDKTTEIHHLRSGADVKPRNCD